MPGDEITNEQVRAACDVMERYGRQGFKEGFEISRGRAIGRAMAGCNDVSDCITAAIGALEDWNCHLRITGIAVKNTLCV